MMKQLTAKSPVGVIGAGTMGAGIAQVAAAAGHPVFLYDAKEGAAQAGKERLSDGLSRLVAKGKTSAQDAADLLERIRVVDCLQALASASLVIEAIVERLDIKQALFRELESICAADCILASNTSSISITAIGSALQRPENLVGMHFFNPAPIMKLVEVISGLDTASAVAEQVLALATAWGKEAVPAASTPGFIVNRVARPFYAEGLRVVQEGGSDCATFDALMRECGGFRMGPFELMDLIGHDVNFAVTRSVFEAFYHDPRFLPSLLQQALVEAGHLGRKSGKGFYDYASDAMPAEPSTAAPAAAPASILVAGDLGVAEPLLIRAEQAGIQVLRRAGDGQIQVGEAILRLTDGQYASTRAKREGCNNLLHYDLALDYTACSRIALSPADQTSIQAVQQAVGFFQAIGISVSLLDDTPGSAVMRTVAMLANAGVDAVNQQVCLESAVDTAMKSGVNYPRGPIEWARKLGLEQVLSVLDNLAATYGEDRYRASPLLRRWAARSA